MNAFDAAGMQLEVKGVSTPHALFCASLTGWITEVAVHMGWRSASAKHVKCRAKGDSRCLWEVRASLPDAAVPASRK